MSIMTDREKERQFFSKFLNKKVEIEQETRNDLITIKNTLKGKIIEHPIEKGEYIFIKSRAKKSFYRITLGLLDGFYATITVKNIKEIKQ